MTSISYSFNLATMSSSSSTPAEQQEHTEAKIEPSSLRPPPNRGILKKPSVYFDKDDEGSGHQSRLKWDEESLLVTEAMRGTAKMKIDEPKTPYVYYDPTKDKELQEDTDAAMDDMPPLELTEPAKEEMVVAMEESEDDWHSDEELNKPMTEEEQEHHHEFEQKRSEHYNMRDAMRRARELMEEEGEGDDDDNEVPPVPPLPKFATGRH
ncbi:hypothetical protein BDF19DRAFT_447703 [Syncephalis fuscata]|nr:hypothetical protein BDF19DRAFT_447703 [Syncephalis fuscata]